MVSIRTGPIFLLTKVLVVVLTIVRLFIVVGLVTVAQFFSEDSAFFKVAITPMFETKQFGCSIPVEPCVFLQTRNLR